MVMNKSRHAIIIGSGVAGMALSVRLAASGYSVHVLEANDYPGGKISMFEKDGYRFDAGPSLFTQPEQIEALFQLAGKPIEKYFSYVQSDVVCHYFFDNGKRLKTYADQQLLAEEFEKVLGEKKQTVLNYLADAERLYEKVGTIFLNHSLHDKSTWLHKRVFGALKTVRWYHLFQTMNRFNETRFRSKEAVQLFNRFATYNGSNPYKAPAMLTLIPHLEQNQGTYYPKGGMISITNALYQLATDLGVRFSFGRKAEKIIHDKQGVKGVVAGGELMPADLVTSNGDVYYTYQHLLQDKTKSERIEKMERSSSAIIFYWGINRSFRELGLHNIFFTGDYQSEFSGLFDTKQLWHDPTVYINITAKMEAGHAPDGCENWFVMVNAPEHNGQDWAKISLELRERIIQKLSAQLGVNLCDHIVTELTLDPSGISNRTHTYKGSLYGTSSNAKMAAFFRPPNYSSAIHGLYFCGGTVHPGGGIPLSLKSAEIVASMIDKKYGRQ